MNRTFIAGAIIALASATTATADELDARLRVIHASPDAPAVDVRLNGSPAIEALSFNEFTDYVGLDAGSYQVEVVPAGLSEPVVIDATLDLLPATDYTVLAVNTLESIEPLVLVDDNTIDPDNARVRFVHASPDAPAVDIAVADGGPVLFGDVEFTGIGDYLAVPGDAYDLEVRVAGTPTVVLELDDIGLQNGRVYTVVATGLVSGDPALGALLVLDETIEGRVRVVHASPDAPAVDVFVDGDPVFSDVSFTDVTDYVGFAPGVYGTAVAGADGGPVVLVGLLPVLPGIDATVVAAGVLDELFPILLIDDNTIDPANARVRFVHASPNAPAVDVALASGGPVLFGDVEFTDAEGYIEVPEGVYDLEVRLAGTDTVVLPLPGIALSDSTVYTAYAVGLVGAEPPLQAILSVDAFACEGDLDGDGVVHSMDIIALLALWETDNPVADIDGDGFVGTTDLLKLLANFGDCF